MGTDLMNGVYSGDTMTGFNPTAVKMTIENLYDTGVIHGIRKVSDSVGRLFWLLSRLWFSPNAVKFYDEYAPRIHDLIDKANKTIINICKAATDAYNVHATANGLGSITFDKAYVLSFDYDKLMEKSTDNKVGMYMYYIDQALDEFRVGVVSGLSYLDSIPTTIELFDPDSEQRKEFIITITTMRQVLYGEIMGMADEVQAYMKTEENTAFHANEEAIVSLRGY